MKLIAVCLLGLVLVGNLSAGTAGATTGQSGRKLLQPGRRTNNPNLAANTVRAQAATAQSIEEAVKNGGSLGAAQKAGQTGVTTSWAASQRQDTFNFVDRNSGPLNSAFGH